MRRAVAIFAFASLSAALSMSFLIAPSGGTRAAADATGLFVLPPNDGYGVADCIANGAECGAVVAQSWCTSHGFSHADRFGRDADGNLSIACGR